MKTGAYATTARNAIDTFYKLHKGELPKGPNCIGDHQLLEYVKETLRHGGLVRLNLEQGAADGITSHLAVCDRCRCLAFITEGKLQEG